MIRRSAEEEEEEEGLDLTTMSLFSSQPSSPSSPYDFGFGCEEDGFKFICFPPSLPSPPLSPLWKLSDDHPISTKVNSVPQQLPSNLPFKRKYFYKFPFLPESQHSFYRYDKSPIRGLRPGKNSIKVVSYKGSPYIYFFPPYREAEENRMILLKAIHSMMQNMSISSYAKVSPSYKKLAISQILQIEDELNMCIQNNLSPSVGSTEVELSVDASVYLEMVTAVVVKVTEFSQTDPCSLNQNHESVTLKEAAYGAIAKLDPQQHLNMTRREAAKSFGVGQASPQSATVKLPHTFSLEVETPKQDVGSVILMEATDDLSPNKAPMSLAVETSSTVEAIHDTCEVDGLASNTINQRKRSVSSSKSALTGSSISLEDLQQHCNMTREKAADNLGVSVSTLKRACRQHGISSWLHLKRRKKSESPSDPKSMNITKQDNIASDFMTIKATYADKTIKFKFPYLSEMAELEEQIAKMLNLKAGSFSIEYEDEDGDQILLTSSQDLRLCIEDTWTSLHKTTIRMFVKLTTS